MRRARKRGRLLKLVTLTFRDTEAAGLNTAVGQKARMLALQHFVQWLRRRYGEIEYLRVAETHKNGRVHLHLLMDMPYVPQRELQSQWGRRVFIEAVFVRCHCWPGREATDSDKARSRVFQRADGTWRCANGHSMNVDQAERRFSISAAWEVGKYLSKQSDVGRMSRSRNWIKAVPPMPEDTGHEYRFGGQLQTVATAERTDIASLVLNMLTDAWMPVDGEKCGHWGDGVRFHTTRSPNMKPVYPWVLGCDDGA